MSWAYQPLLPGGAQLQGGGGGTPVGDCVVRQPLVTRFCARVAQQPDQLPNLVAWVSSGTNQALEGAAVAGATAAAGLDVGKPLAGDVTAGGSADGAISVGKPIEGSATAGAIASADLSAEKALEGAAIAGATASGMLDTVAAAPFRLLDQPNPIRVKHRQQPTMHRPTPDAGTSTDQQLEGAAVAGATASAELSGGSRPFAQFEWWSRTRVGGLDPSQDWVNVLFRPAAPFWQNDWQNPVRRRARQQFDKLGGVLRSTTVVTLEGAALAGATASGAVSVTIPLSGSAVAVSSADGALALTVTLSGAAIASAVASAALTGVTALEGSAIGGATAGAALSIDVRLTGAAVAGGLASSNLTITIPLSGAAIASAIASGELTLNVPLSGAAIAGGQASGELQHGVSLAGDAVAGATAWASFPDETLSPVEAYTVTARRRALGVRAIPRQYTVTGVGRVMGCRAPRRSYTIAARARSLRVSE